ncbi:MAG: superoxide dismutase [Phycisphaeraceae bacterium]|nr:superoxide dismutase [Phycisphaeraceae bacterium]MCW5762458.1 superoxide dismutase [Phycisphaeraceae bacterium]
MERRTTIMESINRRAALGTIAGLGGAASLGALAPTAFAASLLTADDLGWDEEKLEYTLPPLPYAPEALEPAIDRETMTIHHSRHHASYVAGLNRALKVLTDLRHGNADSALISHWSKQLSFHGSGHVNHTLFWLAMAPPAKGGGGMPNGKLASQIERDFGSYEQFAAHFKAAATAVEASGWAWLAWEPIARQLLVLQMENQQKLLMTGVIPILGIDVWEHAYYLKYQNRRADYVDAFMTVINWGWAAKRFEAMRP